MQTSLAADIKDTPRGREADAILRSCVHCGFCTATCPTYQELNDERDGPRGRIYLIKQVLEGQTVGAATRRHLDRCLTCRSCETTCPSGVQYARLLDIGRELVDERLPRSATQRLIRRVLRFTLRRPTLFRVGLTIGQGLSILLPAKLRAQVPPKRRRGPWPSGTHPRTMLSLAGCVQGGLAPDIDAATARVLDRLGITLKSAVGGGCCGLLSHHLGATEEARADARANIDAWWPDIEAGAEAIVITASACGAQVKDYPHLLGADPDYADKARTVASLARDVIEVLENEDLSTLRFAGPRIAFHSPCSLQHGQGLGGRVEQLLTRVGFQLSATTESHLCCGSAGTYSLFQPELSGRLRGRKLAALTGDTPQAIATANIGCLVHLQGGTQLPVKHWVEWLEAGLEK